MPGLVSVNASIGHYSDLIRLFTDVSQSKKTGMLPLRVQNSVTLIAIEMHNSFEKQDSIHRDTGCL
jgi:hypothetical protein